MPDLEKIHHFQNLPFVRVNDFATMGLPSQLQTSCKWGQNTPYNWCRTLSASNSQVTITFFKTVGFITHTIHVWCIYLPFTIKCQWNDVGINIRTSPMDAIKGLRETEYIKKKPGPVTSSILRRKKNLVWWLADSSITTKDIWTSLNLGFVSFLLRGNMLFPSSHGINGGFLKWWYPQIIHFNRVFHYKPSIFRYPYFLETIICYIHPYLVYFLWYM